MVRGSGGGGVGGEVEADVMRGRRGGEGERAGEADLDAAVQMAAQHALDVGVAGDDRGEAVGAAQQALPVHVADQRAEGRMM